MDNQTEALEKLKTLRELQDTQNLELRVRELEDIVSSLESTVQELLQNFTGLQTEFNRDHKKLGRQDAPYRNK